MFKLQATSGTQQFRGEISEVIEVREPRAGATEVEVHTGSGPVQTIDHQRWERDRVTLAATETIGSGKVLTRCEYRPQVVLVRLPLVRGRIIHQTWRSPECSGAMDVEFLGRETVADATGHNWSTWKIRQRTTSPSGTLDATMWIAPAIGIEVKAERRSLAHTKQGDVESSQTTLLLGMPSD